MVNWPDPGGTTPHGMGPDDQWLDERLEAYLDGELSPEDTAHVERILAQDEAHAEALSLADDIQRGLRRMAAPTISANVATRVIQAARTDVRRSRQARWQQRWKTWMTRMLLTDTWRPALAMATLVALVVSATLIGAPTRPATAPYSASEVDVAMEDVKLALAYLSEVGRRTGTTVRQDVLEQTVMLPIHHALEDVRTERAN